MKKFKNKQTKIEELVDPKNQNGEVKNLSYADLIIRALKQYRPEGFSYDEQKKRFRIIDVMEESKIDSDIKLEDADAEHLKSILSNFKWLLIDKDIIAMTDAVINMENTK